MADGVGVGLTSVTVARGKASVGVTVALGVTVASGVLATPHAPRVTTQTTIRPAFVDRDICTSAHPGPKIFRHQVSCIRMKRRVSRRISTSASSNVMRPVTTPIICR